MSTFSMLNEIIRAFFALWALLLCLFNIANSVLAFTKRKYLFGVLSVLAFGLAYTLWQVIFDYALKNKFGSYSNLTELMVGINWLYWLLILFLLTSLTAILFIYNIHYERNNITANSIKLYLDKVDCGVCCYKDNGRLLFSNICINQLSTKITGSPLLNGNHFKESLTENLVSVEDEKWMFSCRDIILNNDVIHEIKATNVTNEYNKTKDLEKDKLELSRIKKELEEYNLSINEVVKHQEILQAKINIHDEMNRLMLSTVMNEDPKELDKIFSLWEQNTLLLSKEVEDIQVEESIKRLTEIAKSLKMNLVWDENTLFILDDEQKGAFFQTAQEAMANASKHASATNIFISIEELNKGIKCKFINKINAPLENVKFTGGLSNLEKLVKKYGASIKAEVNNDDFVLTLSFSYKK